MNRQTLMEYIANSIERQLGDSAVFTPLGNIDIEFMTWPNEPVFAGGDSLICCDDPQTIRIYRKDDEEQDLVEFLPYASVRGLEIFYARRDDSPSIQSTMTPFTQMVANGMNRQYWKNQIEPFIQLSNVSHFAERGIVQTKRGYVLTLQTAYASVSMFPKDRVNTNDEACICVLVEGDHSECVHRILWEDIMGLTVQIDADEVPDSREVAECLLMGTPPNT